MTKSKKNSHSSLLYVLMFLFLAGFIGATALALLSAKKVYALQEQVSAIEAEAEQLKEENTELKANELPETLQLLFQKISTLDEKQLEDLTSYLEELTKEPEEPELPDFVSENPEDDELIPEGTDMPESETATFANELSARFPSDNGTWSLYLADLKTGEAACVDSHSMQAASLIKLYIMGAVYENYEALSEKYGAQTLDSLLTPMITVSDNDASNTLVSYLGNGDSTIGMAIVNYFCQTHGFKDSHMGRLLLHSNEYDDNYTSVADCGKFLTAVYEGANSENGSSLLAHTDSMYALLKQQTRQHKIPANLPENVKAANKTGELADVENDAAILYHLEEGNDLVICFMTEYISAPGSAQSKIAELSRSIYDHYNP